MISKSILKAAEHSTRVLNDAVHDHNSRMTRRADVSMTAFDSRSAAHQMLYTADVLLRQDRYRTYDGPTERALQLVREARAALKSIDEDGERESGVEIELDLKEVF